MSKIAKSFVELIGKTPLLAATRLVKGVGADAKYFQLNLNTLTQVVP